MKAIDLIPSYRDYTPKSFKDIISYGETNVREIKEHWEYRLRESESQIKRIQEKIDFLVGKSPEDFIELAKQYENPEFPNIGINSLGGWSNSPEPLDDASIKREAGATTFNCCGWCDHVGCGTCRYGYHIEANCDFENYAGIKKKDYKFNTPCFFLTITEEYLDKLKAGLEKTKKKEQKNKSQIEKKIAKASELELLAERKPCFSGDRPCEWFNIDDVVVCYIASWKERIVPNKFAKAKVIDGYRHHDGCVSVSFDDKVHDGDYLDGHGSGYGMARPEIMFEWEYEYLVKNPDFAKVWATEGVGKYMREFDTDQFLLDLKEAAFIEDIKEVAANI